MSSRPPAPPPQLPGYEYEKLLGSGGFADVFLYRQFRPQRRVAIKVLLSTVHDDTVHRQFEAEANVMATMSTHPSIVTIHTAEVSDDHRPYLVMEYCPRPNYGVRFRKERITVAEALRVGVQIAGAVETAHRAGILHRDIKPANILVTEYNRPALTDFGISIAAGQAADLEDTQGMSIPWSPPELFTDPPRVDVRSDLFSLAATLYSLLAGQTPFERPGQRNTASDLIHRISSEPLQPLNRPDIPPQLNRLLSIAMAKDPAARYDTALAFGRGLQQVEQSLSLPVTQMDILDDRSGGVAHAGEEDELDMHTRIRKVATVDPETGAAAGTSRRPRHDPYAAIAPALGSPEAPSLSAASASQSPQEATMLRPAGPPPGASAASPPPAAEVPESAGAARRTPAWPFVTLAAVFVVLLGVASTFAVRTLFVEEPDPIATSDVNVAVPAAEVPDPPHSVTVEVVSPEGEGGVAGKARVSWATPADFKEDYFYQVRWKDLPANYERDAVTHPVHGRSSHTLDMPQGLTGRCVEVQTVTPDGGASDWVEACLDGD
ncbi:MAG TPA: serine/threonine protein kinase [Candidatus Brachybacterium merdavium]|uniref:non-specific serine/threonine protein kinase n=1 Tax=Candidatus Brachybacterium merdavium TaxID=2838513 RepID=A0A9D2LEY5_9MICO|nr:serine/threonine protein kinase [Candidatus Brachybacterium merdavium]